MAEGLYALGYLVPFIATEFEILGLTFLVSRCKERKILGIHPSPTEAVATSLIPIRYKGNFLASFSCSCFPPKGLMLSEISVRGTLVSYCSVVLQTNDEILLLTFFNVLILNSSGAGSPAGQHSENTCVCKLSLSLTNSLTSYERAQEKGHLLLQDIGLMLPKASQAVGDSGWNMEHLSTLTWVSFSQGRTYS